jgi:hypothetical protein
MTSVSTLITNGLGGTPAGIIVPGFFGAGGTVPPVPGDVPAHIAAEFIEYARPRSAMLLTTLIKPVYNDEWRVFDFSTLLAVGETVTTAGIVVNAVDGTDMSTSMVSDVQPYQSSGIVYKLRGGVSRHVYTRHFQVVTNYGNKLEDSAKIKVV